jgi:hypothetical protein
MRHLEELLARKRSLEERAAKDKALAPRMADLRSWQARRLARTYDDLRGDTRYARAMEFFLSDLYGPHDFSGRDRDLMRAWRYLKHSLPATAMEALGRAIELEILSAELDEEMVAALPPAPVTSAAYCAAYRSVGRRDARERQIELVVGVGEDLDRVVRRPWVGRALQLAHAPAHAAGFGVLQDFLERGFAAFRGMRDARPFLETIRDRETKLLEALFAGEQDPFVPPGLRSGAVRA